MVETRAMSFSRAREICRGARGALRIGVVPKVHRSGRARGLLRDLLRTWAGFSADEQRELLLRLTPTAFDDDRGDLGDCASRRRSAWKGDVAGARQRYADEARARPSRMQLRDTPERRSARHALLGVVARLISAGVRRRSAQGQHGSGAAAPSRRIVLSGPYLQHLLARIYTLVGTSRRRPSTSSSGSWKRRTASRPAWLAIDPELRSLARRTRASRSSSRRKSRGRLCAPLAEHRLENGPRRIERRGSIVAGR